MSWGEVIEVGKDNDGEYARVWDGGRDHKGQRCGIHTFYGSGYGDLIVGRKVDLKLMQLPEEPEEKTDV